MLLGNVLQLAALAIIVAMGFHSSWSDAIIALVAGFIWAFAAAYKSAAYKYRARRA